MRNSYCYIRVIAASVSFIMKSRITFTHASYFKMSRETNLEGKGTMGDADKNVVHEKCAECQCNPKFYLRNEQNCITCS